MTLTCLHCGPVVEDDPAIVARIERRLRALAVGNAPLAPVAVCPQCNAEAEPAVLCDASGRVVAPAQHEPPARPDGPWNQNGRQR